ncbi:MarR family winged helix-turn-helix transcriptional regulator [Pseudotabrizicola alkalilacus]|uniref:MarR family transcriptional regulator n=1 Tax=Pseudotabrizicola alkalilacus TaxID=2305252 RepID=A0A411YYU8_9RHOB|nr:MarR family transcriptional regulator [Pseudotabrizicola alkalilacus]RGP35919.1 MarR family transcriptional regulator [Pseudotabrizicola alkalilacus]
MIKSDTPKPRRHSKFPFRTRESLRRYVPHLITRLAHRWAADQNVALAELGWNSTMMRILASLSAHKELTINELAVLSVTEQSTTSRTTESLVTTGLVSREISDSDQRVRTVGLTELGTAKLNEIGPVVNDLYEKLIKDIDEEELETCIRVLQKMTANICVNKI